MTYPRVSSASKPGYRAPSLDPVREVRSVVVFARASLEAETAFVDALEGFGLGIVNYHQVEVAGARADAAGRRYDRVRARRGR